MCRLLQAFFRRMDLRVSTRRRRRAPDERDCTERKKEDLVIGHPVLVSYQSASPPQLRMMSSPGRFVGGSAVAGQQIHPAPRAVPMMGTSDIPSSHKPAPSARLTRDWRGAKRHGRIFDSPSNRSFERSPFGSSDNPLEKQAAPDISTSMYATPTPSSERQKQVAHVDFKSPLPEMRIIICPCSGTPTQWLF